MMGANHSHASHGASTGNLRTAFLLNLGFTVIEIAGGIWTNSIAIISDAVHDFGDTLALGSAWYFDRLSKRGRTAHYTYGYRRYSLLGGLITAVALSLGLVFVLWHAVGRLFAPEPVNAEGMILLALLGVAFNGAAVLRVRKGSSLTEQVVSLHLLEDMLGWLAVLIGAVVMSVWDVPVLDPILSIAISLFVLRNVLLGLRRFFSVFLQRVPESFDIDGFERRLLTIPKVRGVHHTHSWSIDGEKHVLTTHLVMDQDADREDVVVAKSEVGRALDPHTFEHLTVDVELEGEQCMTGRGELHEHEHEAEQHRAGQQGSDHR